MKRLFQLAIILFTLTGAFIIYNAEGAPGAKKSRDIRLEAQNAVLMDQATGEILFEKKQHEKCYPASTTKILTALTAIDYADLKEQVVIGDAVNFAAPDSSKAGIKYDEILSLEQLLNAMLIPSGNDAAYSIAAYVGKKTGGKALPDREAVEHFCALMNEKAEKLGALDSHFTNPDGYHDDNHYTTAYDMALIARELMNCETLKDIVKKTNYRLPDTRPNSPGNGEDTDVRLLGNTNRLIQKGDMYFYPYCTGIKTGHTSEAGYCLIVSGEKDGRKVTAVVMGSSEEGVWTDAVKLLDYGFNNKWYNDPYNPVNQGDYGMKILLVDDEKEIVDLAAIYLRNEGFEVSKAYNAKEALSLLSEEQFHLVVLDIMMPGMNGLDALAEIRKSLNIPVILLSAKSEDNDKIIGLTAGADDYMAKPFNPLELTARVRSQIRRYLYLNSQPAEQDGKDLIRIGGLAINPAEHTVTLYGQPVTLTPTEYDILLLLASNRGRVFPAEEIFRRVWKEKYFDSGNTIMVHIRKIREKIEENPRKPLFIKTVWGVGYKIEK